MKSQLVLLLKVIQWQESLSMSMVHITIRDHVNIPNLGRGLGPFMFKGSTELSLSLTSHSSGTSTCCLSCTVELTLVEGV